MPLKPNPNILLKLATPPLNFRLIGLMSGTSLDGLDIALVEFILQPAPTKSRLTKRQLLKQNLTNELAHKTDAFDIKSLKLNSFKSYAYPAALKQEILSAIKLGKVKTASRLNFKLGVIYAGLVNKFIRQNKLHKQDILAIAAITQTIYHAHRQATYQIGEADCIAKHTGLPVIYDFRSSDVAVGGAGAPLVVALEAFLTAKVNSALSFEKIPTLSKTKAKNSGHIAFQNLGGIGNVSFIREDGWPVSCFDTGPANLMSNIFSNLAGLGHNFFDKDARLAQQGKVASQLVDKMLQHSFLQVRPPKTTGHEEFGVEYCQALIKQFPTLKIEDFIRSALLFCALSMQIAYKKFGPANIKKIILSGGGVHNPVLLADIKKVFYPRPVCLFSSEFGMDDDAKEAVLSAFLGAQRLLGQHSNFKHLSGAKQAVCLGKFALPD